MCKPDLGQEWTKQLPVFDRKIGSQGIDVEVNSLTVPWLNSRNYSVEVFQKRLDAFPLVLPLA